MSTWRFVFEVDAEDENEALRKIADKLPFMHANGYTEHGSGRIVSLEEVEKNT